MDNMIYFVIGCMCGMVMILGVFVIVGVLPYQIERRALGVGKAAINMETGKIHYVTKEWQYIITGEYPLQK